MAEAGLLYTLEEYQKGQFQIPESEFIYYVNNDNFIKRWYCLNTEYFTYYKKNKPKFLLHFLKDIFLNRTVKYSMPGDEKFVYVGNERGFFDELKIFSREALIRNLFILFETNPKQSYVVIFGDCDYEITDKIAEILPKNICFLYANNLNTNNERVKYLPLGRDFRSSEYFTSVGPEFIKKRLCYCNFSISTHKFRPGLYNAIRDKDFIDFEHMGKFSQYEIGRNEYYNRVSESKFNICPRGNGLDTFRLWDSLYLGSVPIVVREAVFHKSLNDLPILFLDSYDDFKELSKENLDTIYEEMLTKRYNYKKLMLSYWFNLIENC